MASSHDKIADRLASKLKTKHRRQGVDIIDRGRAIEVAASESDMQQSVGQLNRSRASKKYMAVPSSLIPKAKKTLEGSGIGIMNAKGRIIKRSRKRR